MPEPQTLLTVVQPTASGNPAARAAWRAGAWPRPAGSTQPMMASETSSGATPASSMAARIATAASCGAGTGLKPPWKAPMGVRRAAAMTMVSWLMIDSSIRIGVAGSTEQLAADQHAADLAGARADLVELGIAQQPPGGIFVDVTVAAEDLHRLQGERHGGAGGEQQAGGGVHAGGLAAVELSRHAISECARRLEGRVHVGDLRLHDAEAADRLTELLAFVQVRQRRVHAGLHDAERSAREHET